MNDKNNFVFGKDNYIYIIGGIVLTIIGFILMMGGGSDDRMAFNGDELFSKTRITVAPFLVILGYAVVIYGIMKKRKIS
jgi:uncharacterized membrane protein